MYPSRISLYRDNTVRYGQNTTKIRKLQRKRSVFAEKSESHPRPQHQPTPNARRPQAALTDIDRPESRPRALVLFAGPPDRRDGLPAYLRRLGFEVDAIDTKIGGAAHDVTDQEVTDKLMAAATAGRYAFVFAAPPCQSYSVAHRPRSGGVQRNFIDKMCRILLSHS